GMRGHAAGGDGRTLAERAHAVQAEGNAAIAILHGILRSLDHSSRSLPPDGGASRFLPPDGGASPSLPPPLPAAPSLRARREWVRPVALISGGLATILLLSVPLGGPNPSVALLALLVPAAAVAAEWLPLSSAVVASMGMVAVAVRNEVHVDGLLPVGVFLALHVWNLATELTPRSGPGLAVLVLSAGVLGWQYGRPGMGFVLVATVLAFVSARAWLEKDRIVLDEQIRAARRSAEITDARVRAERSERERIARELHDGVSYAITAMTLHAQAAQTLAGHDPDRAAAHLRTAESAGVTALEEIDALCAAWRRSDRLSADIPALVGAARAFGQDVVCEVGPAGAPPGRLAFRIVQECLTNAARYAPGAQIRVRTGVREGQWFVCVADSGAPGGAGPSGSAEVPSGMGSGLRGLAARVHERGGVFQARASASGFDVCAFWPVGTSSPESADSPEVPRSAIPIRGGVS
ncbi:MAG TPA: hypothetical protein GX743_07785, partial [Actinomycetales bacterium]|nr:hypothetical protein [Actinomycetales bacterium]